MGRKSSFYQTLLAVTLIVVLGWFLPVVQAQTVTGTIVGMVTDPTGAVVPAAKIVVTNDATKVAYNVTTNEAGQYVVPFLSPGKYTAEAEAQGFKKRVVRDVIVEVEQRVRLDFALEVGAVTEAVEVISEAPLLNTETSSVGQVIENKKVVDLPLNGRQFMELSFLVPAVHQSAPGHFNEILQGFAASGAGGRPTNNNFTLDGVDNVSPNCGYFSVSPSVDAVQEFKIQTSNYSAEFGRTSGVVINVATKSGTNEFHGSLFEFVRNDIFDARNFFNVIDRNHDGKADAEQIRRNDFGGSIGGPIIKGKTFFFYNQEHLRQRQPRVNPGRVPIDAEKQGDFSQAGFTVYDPATTRNDASGVCCIRDPFPRNVIPSNRFSPVTVAALKFYPTPNNPGDPQRNFLNLEPFKRDTGQYIARVDHRISAMDNFFGRYAESDRTDFSPGSIPGMGAQDYIFHGKNAAANWVHTFSPRLVNEFRAGYNRLNFGYVSPRQGTDFAPQLGIKGAPGSRLSGFPIFGITGFTGLGDIEPYGNIDNIYQLVNIMSYTKGRHSIRFGIDVRRIQNDYFISRSPSGSYSLSGAFTSAKPGQQLPIGFADFLLGVPDGSAITYIGDIGRTRTTNWNAFIQDDWRVTSNLTINLGLRYELYTPPKDKFGRQGYMDPKDGALVFASNAPLNDPIPGAGIKESDLTFPVRRFDRDHIMIGDNNNFGPRFGFAYKLPFSPNTVIRGGYGISYVYFPFSDIGVNTQRLLPFAIQVSLSSDFDKPTLDYNFDVGGARNVLLARTPVAISGISPDVHWGDVQQWNLDIQHQFAGNWLLDVGYLGNSAHHLAQRYPTNVPLTLGTASVQSRRPFPRFAGVNQVQSDINNSYNALTARLEKRFSKGYTVLASYTWAKSIGYGSEVYGTPGQESGAQDPRNNFKLERGLAPDDIRQRLVFSSVWELPFGKGHYLGGALPGPLAFVVGGWQANTIVTLQTGFHTTASGGARTNLGAGQRPDQICNPNQGFQFSVNQAFNTSCFAKPALVDPVNLPGLTRFGTAPRDSIETKGMEVVDFSVFKNNRIRERFNVQFRAEAFNLFNHPNFASYGSLPSRNFDSASFGKIFAASDPRLIQLGLKLLF